MLPDTINSFLREKIDVYLRSVGFRPPTFSQRVLARSFGGEVIQPAKVGAAIAQEIESVSTGIFESMQKVIEKVRISPYEGLERDLLQLFDSEFDLCAASIREFGVSYLTQTSPNVAGAPEWFNARLDHAKAARHIDLKLIAAEIMQPVPQPIPHVALTIQNSQVGIIQTGEGANAAGAIVAFTNEQTKALRVAVHELPSRLQAVENLPRGKRAELEEVAKEVEKELSKSQPNQTKVGGLLSMLLAGIKGASTVADIYNVIEVSLKLLGITLLH